MSSVSQQTVDAGCQICGDDFSETCEPAVYDARTYSGQWAFMCYDCFLEYGCGLGTGKGQKYDIKTLKKLEG